MSEKDDWKTFCQHLSMNLMNIRHIVTGSTVELNSITDYPQPDFDMMFYFTDVLGVSSSYEPPNRFRGRIIMFSECPTHPGYVQIQQKEDREFLMTRISQLEFLTEKKGPALKLPDHIQRNPDGSLRNPDIDLVPSILCHGWATAARAWPTRCRPSGWPSNDVVELVVSGGHHLVEKPHPLHTGDDILWRISFSKAECYLIQSWMPEQRNIYHVLRQIKKNVVKACGGSSYTVLCTYHFKTLMLWQCENRPKEFWVSDNISAITAEIICVMIEWLIDKNFPNYFIPENNMLDHLTVDHSFSKEVDFLSDYLDEERLMTFIRDVNKGSVTRSDVKFDTLQYTSDSNIRRFFPFFDEVEIVEFEELELLHTALKLQVELRRSAREIGSSQTTVDSEDTTEQILLTAVVQVQDHQTSRSLDMLRLRVETLLVYRSTNIIELKFLSSRRTFFICVAYLANFYCVTKRDYERSRRLCRKLFECIANCCYQGIVDILSCANIAIAELSFPVLVTTEWLGLFDEDIQTIFGFLRVYGFHANDHNCCSDAIKICPMLFLHYINAQCEMHLGTEGKSLTKALNGFRVHFKRICPSDLHPWDVSVDQQKLRATVLLSALALRRRLLRLL